ncbi:MAG: MoaD/ThiS family protein [Bacteroidia bacterium]
MANILIPTPLRKFTGNTGQVETAGSTVIEALDELGERYPDLRKHLLDEQGRLRNFVRVYVGDDDIKALQGTDTPLQPGSVVSIIPAIAGGCHTA